MHLYKQLFKTKCLSDASEKAPRNEGLFLCLLKSTETKIRFTLIYIIIYINLVE